MLRQELLIKLLCERNVKISHLQLYSTTDSTNIRAKEYALTVQKNDDTALFVANHQSHGRGRLGKSFYSAEGSGIYMSLLIHPKNTQSVSTKLTALTAVILSRSIERLSGIHTEIKWVNDIYANGKKLAGILAESSMTQDGKIAYIVLGMGINVYKTSYPDEISDIATSIEDVCGRKICREELIADIVSSLTEELENLDSDDIYNEYVSRSFVIGKDITVIKGDENYPARVVGITKDFSLDVMLNNGERQLLFSGEISTKISKD